ncbi:MAG: hypothetical protein JWR60_971 [Polaromonas sp.]|nr:hypothetical protein [Polaromonas sp.]
MKNINTLLILWALLAGAVSAHAMSHGSAPMMADHAQKDAVMAVPTDLAEGEVRKVDLENKKITIKHGDIKSLDMPGMTMVFQVRDAALLEKAKAGDKIRFKAEKANGAIVVTDIQPAR